MLDLTQMTLVNSQCGEYMPLGWIDEAGQSSFSIIRKECLSEIEHKLLRCYPCMLLSSVKKTFLEGMNNYKEVEIAGIQTVKVKIRKVKAYMFEQYADTIRNMRRSPKCSLWVSCS